MASSKYYFIGDTNEKKGLPKASLALILQNTPPVKVDKNTCQTNVSPWNQVPF